MKQYINKITKQMIGKNEMFRKTVVGGEFFPTGQYMYKTKLEL